MFESQIWNFVFEASDALKCQMICDASEHEVVCRIPNMFWLIVSNLCSLEKLDSIPIWIETSFDLFRSQE